MDASYAARRRHPRLLTPLFAITTGGADACGLAGAFKQCDFYKGGVLVEVQFGKYAFMFYDLAKFQYFYNRGLIRVGIEIVPCHYLQRQMSSGVSYGEQLIYDLERLSKNFPSVPVKIVLVDMPLEADDYSKDGRIELRHAYEEVRHMLAQWQTHEA